MKQFKVAVFDMDGLLLNSERLALETFLKTCDFFNAGDLSPIFYKMVGTNRVLGDSILKQGLNGIVEFESFVTKWDVEYKLLTENHPIELMGGVSDLLDYVKGLNIPMLVATSTQTQSAKSKLNLSGILHYFDEVIGGDQVTNSKPHPEVYLKAAKFYGFNPWDCIAFEDSANGVKSAVSAGMTVVQIPDLIQPDNELLSLGHIVLTRLDDVISFDFSQLSPSGESIQVKS